METIHTPKLLEPKTDPQLQSAGEQVTAAAKKLARLGAADHAEKRLRTVPRSVNDSPESHL